MVAAACRYTHVNELHDFLRDALVGEEVEVEKVDGGFPVRHGLLHDHWEWH
jgi:hypothetical protein